MKIFKVGEKLPPNSTPMKIIPILIFEAFEGDTRWQMGHYFGDQGQFRAQGSPSIAHPSHWCALPPAPRKRK
jgi:hypothetical protein